MNVVFVEYRVAEASRDAYLRLMKEAKRAYGLTLYEGAEQPGLFVEIWSDPGRQAYEDMRRDRLGEAKGLWGDVQRLIVGGAAKTHIWMFQKVE